MSRRKLASSVSALILAAQLGSPVVAAEPNLEQLSRIEALLAENDVAGLRAYLDRNPGLLEGDGEMAQLMRDFLRASDELPGYLGYRPNPPGAGEEQGSALESLAPAAGGNGSY